MNVVNGENAEIVREFIRKEPKSSLKYMESELGISTASIYRILTENLGYIKVCAKFVPHALKPREKDLRVQHSRDIIKEAKKDRNFLYSIVTDDETWYFQYEPEIKRRKKSRSQKKLAKRSQISSQC